MSVDTLLKRPQENPVPRLTIAKVQEMLQAMSPLYEIVRLVNPGECFELSVTKNGKSPYGDAAAAARTVSASTPVFPIKNSPKPKFWTGGSM